MYHQVRLRGFRCITRATKMILLKPALIVIAEESGRYQDQSGAGGVLSQSSQGPNSPSPWQHLPTITITTQMWICPTLEEEKGKNWDPLATNSVCGTSWELWMRARGRNWWRHDNTALTIFLHPTRNFLTTRLFEWNWNAAKLLENTP